MNQRRSFLRMASAAALPAAAAVVGSGVAKGAEGKDKEFLGAWMTVHDLPFPPGSFREFLSFSDGGVLNETNSFLHQTSNLNFGDPRLPSVINAADGMGNWERTGNGEAKVVFRKMLFDGAGVNFGDLRATGTLYVNGGKMTGTWLVEVVTAAGVVIASLGPAKTLEGYRITG